MFVATDKNDPPKIDFTFDSGKMTVSLTLEENGKSVIKCYTITDGELISPKAISSEEKLPVPSEVLESIGQEAAMNNSK